MSHDILCHTFSFLDYSHTTTLSLVCKEWQQIANSNSLWEFYFHLLTNNRKGKTRVSSSILSEDDLFWKNKMKDNFSQYACRVAKKIIPEGKLPLNSLKGSFPDQFSSQVVKMILSRILVERLETTRNFNMPYVPFNSEEFDDEAHFKMKFKISGIDEPLIARWYGLGDGFYLFGYSYSPHFYLYFSKESDDKLNLEYMDANVINLREIALQGRAFIFKFNGKNKAADVWGKQYLCDNILSHIVPTIKQYEFSPVDFVPYWCFLFSQITMNIVTSAYPPAFRKEIVKHYPNFISNRLVYHYFANYYKGKYTFSAGYATSFEKYYPITESQRKLYQSIIKNKPIPAINTRKKLEFAQVLETIADLKRSMPNNLYFIFGRSYVNYGRPTGEEEVIQQAQMLSKFFKLVKNPEEMKETFLNYKFKRSHQLEIE